jgi:putative FmdB family regulatory protein
VLKREFRRCPDVPLYEYQCPKDGVFEQMRKFSDPPLAACPTCGGPVEKLLSAPAIQFKGTGWYITDYARKGGGDGGKADKGEPKESKDSAAKAADGGSASAAKASTGSPEKK